MSLLLYKSEHEHYWRGISFEARRSITQELVDWLNDQERLAIEGANKNTRVFDQEVGGQQNLWIWESGCLQPSEKFFEGWLEKEDGTRVEVNYYWGEGWLTPDELFHLRQRDPRTAP